MAVEAAAQNIPHNPTVAPPGWSGLCTQGLTVGSLYGARRQTRCWLIAVDLPLAEMSHDEKLLAMELLWADLCQTPERLSPPEWHREMLQQRRHDVAQDTARFQPLDTALSDLKAELRRRQAP